MLKLLPCPNLYISSVSVYPEEFLPTYQNINEGATLSKPLLVSLHSDVELTYSSPLKWQKKHIYNNKSVYVGSFRKIGYTKKML